MPVAKKKKRTLHPWDDWFSKGKFTLTKGRETKGMQFGGQVNGTVIQIYRAASKRGYKASVSVDGDKIRVVVEKKGKGKR